MGRTDISGACGAFTPSPPPLPTPSPPHCCFIKTRFLIKKSRAISAARHEHARARAPFPRDKFATPVNLVYEFSPACLTTVHGVRNAR